MMGRLACFLLSAALAGAGSLAWAANNPVSPAEGARIALAEGDYARVLALTRQAAVTEPTLATNWYRMAIAAARMGEFPTAARALANAEAADPKRTFASSSARVDKLRADIQSGLSQAASGAPAAGELEPAGLKSTTAGIDAIGKDVVDMRTKMDALSRQFAAVSQAQQSATSAADTERSIWIIGFAMMLLACTAGCAALVHRAAIARRESQMRTVSQMPLQDLITFNRDATAALLQRLQIHGQQQSEIYVTVQRMLPVLERESGRAAVKVPELTRGVALAGPDHDLKPAAPVLGRTSSTDIHQLAVATALAGTAATDARGERLAA